MPAVNFLIELPNGERKTCYSPSSVVHRYFQQGDELSVEEFTGKSREALTEASRRVMQKFGFECTAAAAQLEEIESWTLAQPTGTVRILKI